MIKKILKWTAIVLAGVALVAICTYTYMSVTMKTRMNKLYAFEKETIHIPMDSTSIERGKHLVAIKGCQDCHGSKLEGKVMNDDGAIGRLVAANLTNGKGGLPENYDVSDWVVALRHGVHQNGKPLIFMPSHETTLLSQQDLASLVAYCRQVPDIDNVLPENDLGPVAVVMSYLGKMPLLSVEKIDHNKPMVAVADSTEGPAQGKYLAVSCSGCHRENFKGGEPIAPGFPPVPDITSSGHVGNWTKEQFIATLTSGKTPEGRVLKNEDMPWKMTAQYTRAELSSLYQYLQSIH
ncbi:c-type cytochrome [Dyadobacter sp. CY261]|uniref:c-type cytochrome n=1 Tax=Dyadobacter sp. CY261 TaxID=2907203 RepID=UPI001F31DF88|nr:c-type cytochrome [Dyadobacter sp. CY261]MCF0070068.1 c-type cytochrome [Dyadobacter sp. CY261]